MATTSTTSSLFFSSSSTIKLTSSSLSPTLLPFLTTRTRTRTRLPRITATGPDLLGDFGARDPFPAELESNFAEKTLGNVSTEHKILIPRAMALSLAQQPCVPVSPTDPPLSMDDAKELLFKVVGWRIVEETQGDGKNVLKLHCLWKLKDVESGVELINRVKQVAESAGHSPVLSQDNNQVTAVLWTQQIAGLSINDYIVAAKIDDIKVSDLLPRKRIWA